MSKEIVHNDDGIQDGDFSQEYTAQEKSTFVEINRDQEDDAVDQYQKNGDERLFEKIYMARIPTLQIWTRKYYYLLGNKEDMYGEFCVCFARAVQTFKKGKGAFNTWLFTLLLNCARNFQTGRRAKKRLPKGINPNSMGSFMLSLDYSYDGKDGTENTLKDILADKMSVDAEAIGKIIIDETADIMANHNPVVKGFLKRLSDGNTIASLVKEYKTRRGKINISESQIKRLHGKYKQKKIVTRLIRANTEIQDDFSLLDYTVSTPNNLYYTIEMKKTKEADLVMRTIRRLRKDKKNVLSRISV